ncbi:MAG TPA: D-hexose-6-phosphate mutarotase [Propionibacteriaceae bacterium]|nr:D-hexose-6-phosphate mutarotase [Propionibacteriaceae bacterium]HBY22112.1 D-hexose-6-phosphate mutarotase [Propionibacteriaceae bacterium]
MTYEETTNPLRGVEAHPGSGHYGVYDHGAHVWAYQPDGQEPVLWMSAASGFAEGEPIRGGIPIVFPWFAAGPDGTRSPAHGFARLDTWHRSDIKDTIAQDGRLLVEYRLDDAMTRDESDPTCRYTAYTLTKFTPEYLQVGMKVTNEGTEPMTFESALHTYLAVGDVRQVTIDGLDGCQYRDKVAGATAADSRQEGPVAITGETDRVYEHKDTVVLNDPILGRTLEISKLGSLNTVVWNPWSDKAAEMADFADDEWTGMVCIEAGNIGDNAITLLPGQTHTMRQRISLV